MCRGATEHPDEGELRGRGGDLLALPPRVGLGRLDGQVDAVLHDVPGAGVGRLPTEVSSVSGLGDLDGTRGSRET